MTDPLFDEALRSQRRDRASRGGSRPFLQQRAFDDIVDRLDFVRRDFRTALLIGCPQKEWAAEIGKFAAERVDIVEPGRLFARDCDALWAPEVRMEIAVGDYGLCVAVGTLDTVSDLPTALLRIRIGLRPDALLIGAMSGGDTLPRLRSAMRAADAVSGAAAPHVHPRIEASALAGLLVNAGFIDSVVDIDRVSVSYERFGDLVRDLRSMGATNVLSARPREPLSKKALAAAKADFASENPAGRTLERFEILHFSGWTGFSPEMPIQG